ncbi:MAG: DUF1670 domain-containing protein [Deinococcota bacterium]
MNDENRYQRLLAKTPQQNLLHILEHGFHFAPRIAEAIVTEAQNCLGGRPGELKPGQMRVILVRCNAGAGQPLPETPKAEVIWTVDAGAEDRQVLRKYGARRLRQVRLQRLLDEAFEQGALATQEDLAMALQTSLRTIKRDFAHLHALGMSLPSRGYLQGIGRGQSHKALIVGRWLRGETYDQLERNTRHALTSIQRYIQTFVQVVALHRRGLSESQIALLLRIGQPLVCDYLAVQVQHDTPECRARLESQLERLGQVSPAEKGAQ